MESKATVDVLSQATMTQLLLASAWVRATTIGSKAILDGILCANQ
jgi:hypothetical protein